MSDSSPRVVVGCLLDVSGSMRSTLEAGGPEEHTTERLRAIVHAALKLAQAGRQHNPDASMFVGIFGLGMTSEGLPYPSTADLCAIADHLFSDLEAHRSGHDLLISCANENNVPHVSKYIRQKLGDEEA
ncbi:hypothetical protein FSARC_7004 [Fusarium sarcochroum]|uniref:Uncharacterized protein n=1 Tax=Fusarium sarcochroum TaxID=1208366 RepID=A0A8H4TW78_9HYPO|nr:hypothetical protein FSARC_7004 [Fusarium sarcochroum]